MKSELGSNSDETEHMIGDKVKSKRYSSEVNSNSKSSVVEELDKRGTDDLHIDFDKTFEESEISEHEVLWVKKMLQDINEILKKQKRDMEELNAMIIEMDNEIEQLNGSKPDSTSYNETRKMLIILDELLDKLPKGAIAKFANSDDYLLYEKILKRYKI